MRRTAAAAASRASGVAGCAFWETTRSSMRTATNTTTATAATATTNPPTNRDSFFSCCDLPTRWRSSNRATICCDRRARASSSVSGNIVLLDKCSFGNMTRNKMRRRRSQQTGA